jgi:hypothetical protein
VAVVVRCRRDPAVRFFALLGLAMAVLSLGPQLHVHGHLTHVPLPWRGIGVIPLLENVLPGRLALYTDLMAALLVAIGAERIFSWAGAPQRRLRLAGGMAVATAVAVPLIPNLPYPSAAIAVPAFFTDGQAQRLAEGQVVLVAPMQQLFPDEPMLWQAESGFRYRMPQGYFIGPDPSGHPMYGAQYSTMSVTMEQIQDGQTPDLTPSLRADFLHDMRVRDVSAVLVGPMDRQTEMLGFLSRVLGCRPQAVDGVYIWWRLNPCP